MENYRLISVFTVISQIFERIVQNDLCILNYLEVKKMLSGRKFDFPK